MTYPFVRGRQIDFAQRDRFIAVIGSTKPSEALRLTAFNFARQAVQDGFIIISGLAEGIDTAAHEGALSVEGDFVKTVAIVSTAPHEAIYPKSNARLAQDIENFGAVVHPFTTKAEWKRGVRFGQPQKRLVERDILQATLSSKVYAVATEGVIDGGTRWALNYAAHIGIPYYRVCENERTYGNPFFKQEPKLIPWQLELDWKATTEYLQSNRC